MFIELNLDLSDVEADIEKKEIETQKNKLLEIEKNKFYSEMAHRYAIATQLVVVKNK